MQDLKFLDYDVLEFRISSLFQTLFSGYVDVC